MSEYHKQMGKNRFCMSNNIFNHAVESTKQLNGILMNDECKRSGSGMSI